MKITIRNGEIKKSKTNNVPYLAFSFLGEDQKKVSVTAWGETLNDYKGQGEYEVELIKEINKGTEYVRAKKMLLLRLIQNEKTEASAINSISYADIIKERSIASQVALKAAVELAAACLSQGQHVNQLAVTVWTTEFFNHLQHLTHSKHDHSNDQSTTSMENKQ